MECTIEEFREILEEINNLNLARRIKNLTVHYIERYIRQNVAPNFWSKFTNVSDEQCGFEIFRSAVDDLYANCFEFLPQLRRLQLLIHKDDPKLKLYGQSNILALFQLIVRSTLLSQLPLCHEQIIQQFYKIAFNVFCNTDVSSVGKLDFQNM